MKIHTIDTGLKNAMTFLNNADLRPTLENLVFMRLSRQKDQVEYVTT